MQRLNQRMQGQIYTFSVLLMNGYGVNVGVAVEHSRNDNTVEAAMLNHPHVSQESREKSNGSVLLMNG
jgi:hypothetical protein